MVIIKEELDEEGEESIALSRKNKWKRKIEESSLTTHKTQISKPPMKKKKKQVEESTDELTTLFQLIK